MRKYQQLCYEIRERRDGNKVKIIPVVTGCLGGGMKRLEDDVKDGSCNGYVQKCKRLLWESETIMRKILFGLLI